LSGRYSLVGPPESSPVHAEGLFLGKTGLTGLIQLQQNRVLGDKEREQYNLYYAKNQSISLDVEILLKTMLQPRA
jgi:lipopolysaccharide/colanic/teichoic acid biosynthesis glycosyltransferase